MTLLFKFCVKDSIFRFLIYIYILWFRRVSWKNKNTIDKCMGFVRKKELIRRNLKYILMTLDFTLND